MKECTSIEVHFSNVDSQSKEQSNGYYIATDKEIMGAEEDKIIFSWLISGLATKYKGTLFFGVRFLCETDGVMEYQWFTAINSSIHISAWLCNAEQGDIPNSSVVNSEMMERLSMIPTYKRNVYISAGNTTSSYTSMKTSLLDGNEYYALDTPPITFYAVGRYVDSDGVHHTVAPLKVTAFGSVQTNEEGQNTIYYRVYVEIDEPLEYSMNVCIYSCHEFQPQM